MHEKFPYAYIPPKFALRVQPVSNVFCNSLVGDGRKSILEPLKISQDVTKNVGIMARNEEPQPLRCSIIRTNVYYTHCQPFMSVFVV